LVFLYDMDFDFIILIFISAFMSSNSGGRFRLLFVVGSCAIWRRRQFSYHRVCALQFVIYARNKH